MQMRAQWQDSPRLEKKDAAFEVAFRPLMTRREAELLLETDAAMSGENPAWTAYFVENLVEFLVFGERPTGRISNTDAYWLAACLDPQEMGSAKALLSALVRQAEALPACLMEMALACGVMQEQPQRAPRHIH
jgi:hypothetical protein